MRALLAIPVLLSATLASGCISQSLETSSLPRPLDGLAVPTASTFANLTGHVTLPGNGMAILPGQAEEQPLEVPAGALLVRLNMTWDAKGPSPETSDLDLYVYDSEGHEVGRAASLNDPEATSIRITPKAQPGTWTVRVLNFNNPETDYRILVEVVS